MRVLLILCVASVVGAVMLIDKESRFKRSTNEKSFDEKLKEGNQLLKDEPNADDTMKLLEKLHNMEKDMKDQLTETPESNADMLKAMDIDTEIRKDNMEPMGDSIEEINKNSKVETALFQGDMILSKEQADEIMEDVEENLGHRKKRQAFRDKDYPNTLWSRGFIYAFWNASYDAREVFKRAANLWAFNTCINFAPSQTVPDRVDVIKGSGCWSYVGKLGGRQTLSLGPGCESIGVAAHEIGHALGLFHTQSRHDRDDFITLHTENINDGWLSQYIKQTESTNYNYNLTYDYGSIMHYGSKSVTKNGKPSMVPRDIKYIETLGSRELAFYDILMVNMHYGCLDKCNNEKSSAVCENGGFPNPRNCSKCICPSGYGGRLCNERPSGCGKTLTATSTFQTLEDILPQNPRFKNTDEAKTCHYWIEAPAGSAIEVVLGNFTQGLGIDGCGWGGVEIKTGSDKRYTGYKFCSTKSLGTSLVSTHNIVPIITYGKYNGFRTVLRYRIASSDPVTAISTSEPSIMSTPLSTSSPNSNCSDNDLCTKLMEWDFCRSPKYEDNIRELICPKSCGFCK